MHAGTSHCDAILPPPRAVDRLAGAWEEMRHVLNPGCKGHSGYWCGKHPLYWVELDQ